MPRLNRSAPAFPSHGAMGEATQQGMTLRDYFAAKALQGILAGDNTNDCNMDEVAHDSYLWADAMLKARIKCPSGSGFTPHLAR